jgi:hypothetical protein
MKTNAKRSCASGIKNNLRHAPTSENTFCDTPPNGVVYSIGPGLSRTFPILFSVVFQAFIGLCPLFGLT